MKNRGQNIGIIGAGGIGALFGSTMQKKGYNVFFKTIYTLVDENFIFHFRFYLNLKLSPK